MTDNSSKKYLGVVGFGFGIALIGTTMAGVFSSESARETLGCISDGCFLAAVLLIAAGLFSFFNKQGLFDAFSYSKRRTTYNLFGRMPKDGVMDKDMYDYRERKSKFRTTKWYFCYIGLGFLALSALMLVLYHNI